MKFSRATKEVLQYYVYALIDPRSEKIFYVGKANSNSRAFDHLKMPVSETPTQKRIAQIRAAGSEPKIDIIRYGLATDSECHNVEAALIDAIGLENLTNCIRGHGVEFGRQSADDVERLHARKQFDVEKFQTPFIGFFIHETYSSTKSEVELYDATRQAWPVAADRREPSEGRFPYELALAIVDSVAVRAYRIVGWYPAGSTFTTREVRESWDGKWEFVGELLPDHPLKGRMLMLDGKKIPTPQHGRRYFPS